MSRLDELRAKLKASCKRDGVPLPAYKERVEAIKAEIERLGG